MINEINQVLMNLTGLQLTRATRAANMECLKFGTFYQTGKDGKTHNIGEFGLHLQCPWRLTNDVCILVGSDDLFEQIDENAEYDKNFDWDVKNGNLRDIKIGALLSSNHLIVGSAIADIFGGLRILFEANIALTVFPVVSSKAGEENWRLIDNTSNNKRHYISQSVGYEIT